MAPNLSEDEIDDVIYFARAGELADLRETLTALSSREKVSTAEVLASARDESKSSALHMAAGNGNLEIVNALISHFTPSSDQLKTFLDLPNEFANTSLHWACLRGHLDVVKALHAAGASAAVANDKDQIPLDLALFAEKRDVADYFMSQSGGLEGKNEGEGGDAEGLSAGVEGVDVSEGDEEAEVVDAGGKQNGDVEGSAKGR